MYEASYHYFPLHVSLPRAAALLPSPNPSLQGRET